MKPQQLEQIRWLSRCYMRPGGKEFIADLVTYMRWDIESGTYTELNESFAAFLRYLWNRYAPQIRHLQKVERMKWL